MSVLDWIGVGYTAAGKTIPAWMSGSLSLTLGTAIQAFYGARDVHIFGADYKVALDPESMIASRLPGLAPLLALGSGLGGNTTFTYGPSYNFHYIGPQVHVRRCPKWEKTSSQLFKDFTFTGPGRPSYLPAQVGPPVTVPVDKVVDAAVVALSVLMELAIAGLELAIKIRYWKLGSAVPPPTADPTKDPNTYAQQEEDYNDAVWKVQVMTVALRMITPRMLALIALLEQACQIGEFAAWFLWGMIRIPAILLTALVAIPALVTGLVLTLPIYKCTTKVLDFWVTAIKSCGTFVADETKKMAAGI